MKHSCGLLCAPASECPPIDCAQTTSPGRSSPAHAFIDAVPEVEGLAFKDLHFRFVGEGGAVSAANVRLVVALPDLPRLC